MIFDRIKNLNLYKGILDNLDFAFEYIENSDFTKVKVGKHQINGDKVFILMNEYYTKIEKAEFLEAHKKYIDVQYILKGEEIIEYIPLNNQDVIKDYSMEDDYSLYSADNTIRLNFKAGMFAVFFPDDLHMPGIINDKSLEIRKIVIKVLID